MTSMKLTTSVCIWKILMRGEESTPYKGLKLQLIFLVIFTDYYYFKYKDYFHY